MGRAAQRDLLAALAIGALAAATWPLRASPAPRLPAALVAHVCGMLAGYGVLVLLILVARVPALERGVGTDVLTRWHARAGGAVLGLVLVHAGAATAAWAAARQEGLPAAGWQILGLPWLPAATASTLLMAGVGVVSARPVRASVRHERWFGLHLLMYVAVALAFGHELAGPDLAGHRWLQIGWALAYTHVFALVLRHRLLTPLRQAARHRMRVTEVRPEAPDVVSILVEGEHLDELAAQPGQFFRWRFLTPDHWGNAHPFSLSAPPTSTRLRLTVKALGDGTRGLQDVPVGTWVAAEGPYGAITPARRTRRNVLLIAAGVGITPMRALFEALPLPAGGDLLLLYRARTTDEVLFRDELDLIAERRQARVRYLLGEDRQILSAEAIRHHVPDLLARDVFMCGPPGLTARVRDALRTLGLPAEQLHEERFSF